MWARRSGMVRGSSAGGFEPFHEAGIRKEGRFDRTDGVCLAGAELLSRMS